MAVPSRALRAAAEPGLRPEGGSRQKGRAAGGGHSPARCPQPPARSRHNGDGAGGGQTSLKPSAPGPGGLCSAAGGSPVSSEPSVAAAAVS